MSRILIVNDEEPIRRILSIMCQGQSQQIDQAETGPEAMELLRQSAYDLVITDIDRMPNSGPALVEFVRSTYPQTRIVALISEDSPESLARWNVQHFGMADSDEQAYYNWNQ